MSNTTKQDKNTDTASDVGVQRVVILPGSRVAVYDCSGSGTTRPATVLQRYGYYCEFMSKHFGEEAAKYPDMVDVKFDCGRISKGHFTDGVRAI